MRNVRDGITALASRARAADIALHSVLVSVAGETVASAACPPLGPDAPQRMYSVGKTLTGIAVGMLAREGRLDLDDPIVAHFPEMAPHHPFVAATTVRHLLTMRGPHRDTTYRREAGGWLESYFRVPPTHPPGTLFTYDTSGSYVLSALVERVSGGSITEYLRPRLFDPLGVSAGLRIVAGPEGIEHGGSGLICTARDLLKIAQGLLAVDVGTSHRSEPHHGGSAGPLSLVPVDYWRQATTPQSNTAQLNWGVTLRQGYGHQVWLPQRGGWLMFGMGGQIVYGDPAHQLAVVITADSQACSAGDHRLLDDVMDLLVDPLTTGAEASTTATPRETRLFWPTPDHRPCPRGGSFMRHFSGTRYTPPSTNRPGSPPDRVGPGPDSIAVTVDDDGGRVRMFDERHGSTRATAPFDSPGWEVTARFGEAVETVVVGQPAVVTAGMPDAETLDLRVALHGEDLTTWRLRLTWTPDGNLALHSHPYGEATLPTWTFQKTYTPPPG